MAGKNSGSDNPWAEMSRLKLDSKEAKPPSPNFPGVTPAKQESLQKKEVIEVKTTTAASAGEYSTDKLQEMSLKELQALAKESGVDFKGLSKEELINALNVENGIIEEDEEVEEILLEDEEESDNEELEAEEIDGEMSLEEALALLGEDSETEDDFEDVEFEEVVVEVQEGDASFEFDDNNSNS